MSSHQCVQVWLKNGQTFIARPTSVALTVDETGQTPGNYFVRAPAPVVSDPQVAKRPDCGYRLSADEVDAEELPQLASGFPRRCFRG